VSLAARLRALEQRDEGTEWRCVVNDGHGTVTDADGRRWDADDWRRAHPDAATFTLRIARAGAPED